MGQAGALGHGEILACTLFLTKVDKRLVQWIDFDLPSVQIHTSGKPMMDANLRFTTLLGHLAVAPHFNGK